MATVNNKHVPGYNNKLPSNYIYYIDANNLYGYAMSKPLPYSNFKWVTNEELQGLDIMTVDDDSNIGYILEVDLLYPNNIHSNLKDLSFCGEINRLPGGKFSKLLTTLNTKEHYVVHYTTLKQTMKHGVQIAHVYRAIQFSQRPWLKPYIKLKTH